MEMNASSKWKLSKTLYSVEKKSFFGLSLKTLLNIQSHQKSSKDPYGKLKLFPLYSSDNNNQTPFKTNEYVKILLRRPLVDPRRIF